MNSFEAALFSPNFSDNSTGWRQFADESAFVDWFVLTEVRQQGVGEGGVGVGVCLRGDWCVQGGRLVCLRGDWCQPAEFRLAAWLAPRRMVSAVSVGRLRSTLAKLLLDWSLPPEMTHWQVCVCVVRLLCGNRDQQVHMRMHIWLVPSGSLARGHD